MMKSHRATIAAAALFCSAAAQAAVDGACEREMAQASARHGVPLGVLYAVGLTETGRTGALDRHAINVEGAPYFPRDLAAAIKIVEGAQRRGAKLIDVGCMQVNVHFHGAHFPSLAAMFDPAANVDYAARFLKRLRAEQLSWTLAVARYHAGPNNNPAQKRYVCAVIGAMVRSGFGAWTPAARSFCRP
ncbi:MAG: transglycosylase SLT domain-containing protein [Hyphomicrobiales bacterium]|nr:transglycosylase SLT domain-containing protein [Hyphomicrobiales bacterium]